MEWDFSNLPDFETWTKEYFKWKQDNLSFLSHSLPDEEMGIIWEQHNIPRHYSEAGRYQALSEYYYYQSKAQKRMDALRDGQPKSSCLEIAKTQNYKEELLRIDTKNIREDLNNRSFKIDFEYKRIEDPLKVKGLT